MKADERRELIGYLRRFEGRSKSEALQEIATCTEESLMRSLLGYRKRAVALGTAPESVSRALPAQAVVVSAADKVKAKKVPYTLLMPPEQLDALKVLAEEDGASVSHHIRQAVRLYLRGRRI